MKPVYDLMAERDRVVGEIDGRIATAKAVAVAQLARAGFDAATQVVLPLPQPGTDDGGGAPPISRRVIGLLREGE